MFILNGHNNLSLIGALENMLKEAENIDSNFRLVITCEYTTNIPTSVLHSCIKLLVDTPKVSVNSYTTNILQHSCIKLLVDILKVSGIFNTQSTIRSQCHPRKMMIGAKGVCRTPI